MTINASNLAQGNSVTKLCTKAVPKTNAIIPMYSSAYQKKYVTHVSNWYNFSHITTNRSVRNIGDVNESNTICNMVQWFKYAPYVNFDNGTKASQDRKLFMIPR